MIRNNLTVTCDDVEEMEMLLAATATIAAIQEMFEALRQEYRYAEDKDTINTTEADRWRAKFCEILEERDLLRLIYK